MARELKYRSVDTDFSSLERELRGSDEHEIPSAYADLAEDADDGDGPEAVRGAGGYEDLRQSG